jgi:hypothetical protein
MLAQSRESRAAMRDSTVAAEEKGSAHRVFSARESFYTRACTRCAGPLVREWSFDVDHTGEQNVETLRWPP